MLYTGALTTLATVRQIVGESCLAVEEGLAKNLCFVMIAKFLTLSTKFHPCEPLGDAFKASTVEC